MRGRRAHRAADVPDAVHRDLTRTPGELLEHVRAGTQRERVRARRPALRSAERTPRRNTSARSRRGRGPDDGREGVTTARPRWYTVTRRSDTSTTRCQAVEDRVVLAFLIQPVLPFGRPGSLTRSQRVPPLSVRWPITGSTVRPSVIGRFRSTQTRRAERLSGLVIAVCPWTNTASSWDARHGGRRGGRSGAAVQHPKSTIAATDANRGARVRTPVAVLIERDTAAREAGGVHRRQSRAADARRATCLGHGCAPARQLVPRQPSPCRDRLRRRSLLRGRSLRRGGLHQRGPRRGSLRGGRRRGCNSRYLGGPRRVGCDDSCCCCCRRRRVCRCLSCVPRRIDVTLPDAGRRQLDDVVDERHVGVVRQEPALDGDVVWSA